MTVVDSDETGSGPLGVARARCAARRAGRRRVDRGRVAAAALSVLWPGLGHAYLGRTVAAVALVTAQVLLVVLSVLPGAWQVTLPAWGVLLVLAVGSAWRAAGAGPDAPS